MFITTFKLMTKFKRRKSNRVMKRNILKLIDKNIYINKRHKTKIDSNSFSSLIDRKINQSECIKLGFALESFLKEVIEKNTDFKDAGIKKIQGIQLDHLLINESKKKVFYAEVKTNINLDTEKIIKTKEKLSNVEEILGEKFPGYNRGTCLLSCRYISNEKIPGNIKNKYKDILPKLLGLNEYFKNFSEELRFEEKEYKEYLNTIANKMFF